MLNYMWTDKEILLKNVGKVHQVITPASIVDSSRNEISW